MLKNRAIRGYTLRIAIGTIILTLILLTIGAMAQGMTWQVTAGGETPDMAIQGMGFFPSSPSTQEILLTGHLEDMRIIRLDF